MSADFPYRALPEPLTRGERRALTSHLGAIVRSNQRGNLPRRLITAPDATPFITLRVRGRLRGCQGWPGWQDGRPGDRILSAFLAALTDTRYRRGPGDDKQLDIQLSYPISVTEIDHQDLAAIEPGRHGIAVSLLGRVALLLPSVAIDLGVDGPGLAEVVLKKAGIAASDAARAHWFRFETEEVTSRHEPGPSLVARRPWRGAVSWLERCVLPEGRVLFGVNPHTGIADAAGPMLHGRAAVVLQALALAGASPAVVQRGRAWLGDEIERGLRGAVVPCWPGDPAWVAGTLALAVLAGLSVEGHLIAFCEARPEVTRHRWHAAQVGAALGPRTPAAITAALAAQAGASPWSLLAARARGDGEATERDSLAVAASLRAGPPSLGAVVTAAGAELALTALATEALAGLVGAEAQAARRRGRAFLAAQQLLPGRTPLTVPERLVAGAFPLTPTNLYLRTDVTAHAILALG